MDKIPEYDFGKMSRELLNAGQKIFQNYLRNCSGYHYDVQDIQLTYFNFVSKLLISPDELNKVQHNYLEFFLDQQQLILETLASPFVKTQPVILPLKTDKRFASKEWEANVYFNFLKQNHLLIERLGRRIIHEVEINEKIKRKIRFYTEQYADAFSPSNFIATNPEVLKLTIETNGKNLWKGFSNLLKDIEKGRITQTDEKAFELGVNLATTPGDVVFENELIQLIQYHPSTKKAGEIPLLIIPPWINKFYILDLRPENSFVQFLLAQGITVFIISWRNPQPGMGYLTFTDYVEKGTLRSIEVVSDLSPSKKVNALGYCLGGTLLSIAASILSKTKKHSLNTITFLGAMVDFSYIGPMGDVISVALIKKLQREELMNNGVLHGHNMERAFNLIRANDLIWKYVVENYLKGEAPSPFDVMYWTNDNTNLPGKMYIYYLRNMILANRLSRKNALRISDTPIDIASITCPVFVIAMQDDYISPAKTCFVTTELVSGPVEFILGGSGHVIGAINPPAKNKYGYYANGKLAHGFNEWQRSASFSEGSWWTPWSEWLKKNSGKRVTSPIHSGNAKYVPIEPAPGKYVKEKCR